MPAIIVLLVLLGLAGGVQVSKPDKTDVPKSDVIVSTQFGGLAMPSEQVAGDFVSKAPTKSTKADTIVEQALPKVSPILDTLSAQNLTEGSATLRGSVNYPGQTYKGTLYFVYSKDYSEVAQTSANASKVRVSRTTNKNATFTYTLKRLSDDTTYYYRVCFEDVTLSCGDIVSFRTMEDFDRDGSYKTPSVTTKKATDIQSESVTLNSTYRINDSETNYAFFVYGEDADLVKEIPNEYDSYNDVREYGDNLQKVRLGVDVTENGSYSKMIDDLERDTNYYYRFCIAYDDDKASGINCGSTYSFETKSRQRDIPRFSSVSVSPIGPTAKFTAKLSMQDYLDGHVFVVYGTSEERIFSVEEKDTFNNVKQYGNELQRGSIETDFDGSSNVSFTARDLLNVAYFYRFCVEYEAEDDKGRDELVLSCSNVQTF